MGFWTLFEVATMPNLQLILISGLGALLATNFINLLTADARKSLNKIVFIVFTPSLMFASLAKTVTLEDIISWWYMPINIGFTFLIGGILGWILVKIMKPLPHLEGLVIATCSTGNLGNLLLIIVPAICNEAGSPFGDREACRTIGLSYSSFSMALGGFYIWTYTYHLIRSSAAKLETSKADEEVIKEANKDLEANQETRLLKGEDEEHVPVFLASTKSIDDIVPQELPEEHGMKKSFWGRKMWGTLRQIIDELLAPPTIAAIIGFVFGAVTFLRNLIIGEGAPLHVILDSIKLLGDGTIPCITLILGGNLIQGLRRSRMKAGIVVWIICIRYVIQPAIGIWIVKAAANLGFLPSDPLFQFVLMLQYALPPAMNIGTMAQLFDVGQEECSVLFLWTYIVAAFAMTFWSTVFMWILS
ncbi:Auxin efflux carrier family protein [Euphorbia peplus]|nr:Auxin efflux carrier family protein [Euphorbia peplus]